MGTGRPCSSLYQLFTPTCSHPRSPSFTVYLVNHNVFLVSKQELALGHQQQCKQLKTAVDLTGSAAVLQMTARFYEEILVWASFACISTHSPHCSRLLLPVSSRTYFLLSRPSWLSCLALETASRFSVLLILAWFTFSWTCRFPILTNHSGELWMLCC